MLIIAPLRISIAGILYVDNPGDNKDIAPKIQSIVDKAKNGDVIILPAGKFIFNGKITITNMRLSFVGQGNGDDGTLLYRSESVEDSILQSWRGWQYFFAFEGAELEDDHIIISRIYFKSKKPSLKDNDGGSLAKDAAIQLKYIENFIVTNCKFEYFGYSAIYIRHIDNGSCGLINNNIFYHNLKGEDGQGLGYGVVVYGDNEKWIEDPQFGSNKFIFIEDNYFEEHRHSVAGGGCGKYVFRNNTIINNIWGHAIDAHEARGSEQNKYSTRAVEVYNNRIVNTRYKHFYRNGEVFPPTPYIYGLTDDGIQIRGGEALIHNNYIEGFIHGVSFNTFLHEYPEVYPVPYQIGYLSAIELDQENSGIDSTADNGDVFVWENEIHMYDSKYEEKNALYYNYDTVYIKENRDYHLVAKPNYTSYPYPHPLGKDWEELVNNLKILLNYIIFPIFG